MVAQALIDVLEATGYIDHGEPASGVYLEGNAHARYNGRDFLPDAMWRSESALTVYFKAESEAPSDDQIASWRREIWNQGFAPLLWVVSPDKVDLYSGFDRPRASGDAEANRLQTFRRVDAALRELDSYAGRFAMETGQFWTNARTIDRKTSVDRQLLEDLSALETSLVLAGMERPDAQGLIGRSVFAQYLSDRRIVSEDDLEGICGYRTLADVLRNRESTHELFAWLQKTFNGDMFPPDSTTGPATDHLRKVADFLEAAEPGSGQTSLFPYQFDVIPVELISSIYEQFARPPKASSKAGSDTDSFFTPLSLVSLVLDELTEGLTGRETVLDLTCGSGVFLVEALRRLVGLRANGSPPTREMIRSTLHEQIFGVDISDSAVRVAAFSLYLAALELDPEPGEPHTLRFDPLIGKNLLVGDALTTGGPGDPAAAAAALGTPARFDLIVGNPPWSYRGRETGSRPVSEGTEDARAPRGVSLDFAFRALEFSGERARLGLVLSAVQFFSASGTGLRAIRRFLDSLSSPTLVNLSYHSNWLFRQGSMPAMVVLDGHHRAERDVITTVQIPWSPAGIRSHTFEVGRSDVVELTAADWQRRPEFLKAAFFGTRRDLGLLHRLMESLPDLATALRSCGSQFRNGWTLGDKSRDSRHLLDLPLLQKGALAPFRIAEGLPNFRERMAERPRERSTYRAPLLLVEEFLDREARARVAMASRDTVFTKSFYGASLPSESVDYGQILAAILSSSLTSWFFLMTASTFGVSIRRVQLRDIKRLPVPGVDAAVENRNGQRLIRLAQEMQRRPPTRSDWLALDDAVFDLYGLDKAERLLACDGRFRASWQWMAGKDESAAATTTEQMIEYALTFQAAVDIWLVAAGKRQLRAEVIALPADAPLRVARFVLEDKVDESPLAEVRVVKPTESLKEILDRIGQRLDVPLATSIIGQRELRVCGSNEIVLVKPAARRHWMTVAALNDADTVLVDSLSGPTV